MSRYQFTTDDSRKGGRALVTKHGRQHMARIGRRGYAAMVKRHFEGDTEAANTWLYKRGLWTADKDASYGPVFQDPGPHPAHQEAGQ